MTKPQGYVHSAHEALLCLVILGLPHYQSLLYSGLSRLILFCVLALLLLFLAKHSEDIAQAIRRCVFALCAVLLAEKRPSRISFVNSVRILQDPCLPPFLKRPPPSLLASSL